MVGSETDAKVSAPPLRSFCKFAAFWLLNVALFAQTANTAPPVRIYLANDDHTDFFWTADAETYERVFQEMIDYYLDLADTTDEDPIPYQSRFNCDGSYWLWVYERHRTSEEFERVVARLRSGHLSAPMTTLVSCYGGQPLEAVLRGMYYTGRLERRYGLRFPLAVAMENQTLPLGLASLWAGAGAHYTWRGVCDCATRLSSNQLHQRSPEIYWYTGHDGQRVLMKWHSLAPNGNQTIGGYAEAFDPVASIRYLSADPEFLRRYRAPGASGPYAVRGAFGFGWDALDRKTGEPYVANENQYPLTDHFHDLAREHSTPSRQVIASNEEDFFRDFETLYGETLKSISVTYGNEWDLYSASMAETSARVRRAVEKLRAAELLATLVSLKEPTFLANHVAARDRAFTNLGLYWEHDWTADGPVPRDVRAAWQEQLADQIEAYVDAQHDEAAQRLGTSIQQPDPKTERFFVLNPLGWTRTDYADLAYAGTKAIHVRDVSTGNEVPHQFVQHEGESFLRILASNLSSAGYRVFEILEGPGSVARNNAATVGQDNSTLENERVRIALARDGAITSLVSRALPGIEFATDIDGLWLNDLAPNATDGRPIIVENAGPVSVTLKCESLAGLRHTTRLTLFRDSERIELRNELLGNFADVRHWSFSFNLESPDVHAEEVGAIIRLKTKTAGGDYADSHARFDYATLNHFADIADGRNTRGVTLANADCAFVHLGRSTPDRLDTVTPQLNVLAGGQVDGPRLGIHSQNGASYFLQRFALRPHAAYDAASAMRFALEHQNPLVTGFVRGTPESPYPEARYSLVTVDQPSVLLWALKPHEDGIEQGAIARLWNLSSTESACTVTFEPGLVAAHLVTHVETDIQPLPIVQGKVSLPLAQAQLRSLRLLPKGRDATSR